MSEEYNEVYVKKIRIPAKAGEKAGKQEWEVICDVHGKIGKNYTDYDTAADFAADHNFKVHDDYGESTKYIPMPFSLI